MASWSRAPFLGMHQHAKGYLGLGQSSVRPPGVGGGCCARLRALIPSCHQRAELGKSLPLGRRQATRLTSCQDDAVFETETGYLKCRRLHKPKPPGALTGVIVPHIGCLTPEGKEDSGPFQRLRIQLWALTCAQNQFFRRVKN